MARVIKRGLPWEGTKDERLQLYARAEENIDWPTGFEPPR